MKVCPQCQARYEEPLAFCPNDGVATVDLPAEPSVDPLLGRVIDGRYRVERMIGEGGMGVVYAITHAVLGKRQALKVLRGEMAKDAEVVQRFIQEAQSATQIGHENIIDISDFGRLPDGSVYFVMEYLDGHSLSSMIQRGGSIPHATAIHVIRQIASALEAAHARGIVHRDLKPDNIYLVKQGRDEHFVKVLDFGIAKVGGASSKLTRTGMIFGTPHYMSPEQAAGQSVDQRTDIYALGVIMYEMYVGRVPFDGDTFMGILSKHMFEAPIRPSDAKGAAFGAIEDVILRALEKKPEVRYQTMNALISDLDQVHAGGTLSFGRGDGSLADMLEPPSRTELRIAQSVASGESLPTRRTPKILAIVIAMAFLGVAVGGAAYALRARPTVGGATDATGTGTTGATTTGTDTTGTTTTGSATGTTTTGSATGTTTTGSATGTTGTTTTGTTGTTTTGTTGTGAAPTGALPTGAAPPAEAVTVRIVTDPPGANVLLGDATVGQSPATIPRPTGTAPQLVRLELENYEPQTVALLSTSGPEVHVSLVRRARRPTKVPPTTPTTPHVTPTAPTTPEQGTTMRPQQTSEIMDPFR